MFTIHWYFWSYRGITEPHKITAGFPRFNMTTNICDYQWRSQDLWRAGATQKIIKAPAHRKSWYIYSELEEYPREHLSIFFPLERHSGGHSVKLHLPGGHFCCVSLNMGEPGGRSPNHILLWFGSLVDILEKLHIDWVWKHYLAQLFAKKSFWSSFHGRHSQMEFSWIRLSLKCIWKCKKAGKWSLSLLIK